MAKYEWMSDVDPADVAKLGTVGAMAFWNAEYTRLMDKAIELASADTADRNREEIRACRTERGFAAARLSGWVDIFLATEFPERPPVTTAEQLRRYLTPSR